MCETAASLDNLSCLLTALGEPNQRKIRSFFSTLATEVLHQVSQLSNIDKEKMLMDILDRETTSGLNEEELLAETVSFTISESKPSVAAAPRKDMANTMSLTEAADIISEINATQMEPAAVCKITVVEPVYFDLRLDRVKPVARVPACKIAGGSHSQLPACEIADDSHAQPSACKIAEATRSACKTVDIVYLYFSDDEQKLNKVNIL